MNDLKQQLTALAPEVFHGTPVIFAYLYGSHAKGEPHPFSDVDIAVFVESIRTRRNADLTLELSLSLKIDERLKHKYAAEIRTINNLPLTVVGEILKYGHLIYSRDEAKRVEFETQSRLAYFDFLHVIRHHQNIYRKKLLSAEHDGLTR